MDTSDAGARDRSAPTADIAQPAAARDESASESQTPLTDNSVDVTLGERPTHYDIEVPIVGNITDVRARLFYRAANKRIVDFDALGRIPLDAPLPVRKTCQTTAAAAPENAKDGREQKDAEAQTLLRHQRAVDEHTRSVVSRLANCRAHVRADRWPRFADETYTLDRAHSTSFFADAVDREIEAVDGESPPADSERAADCLQIQKYRLEMHEHDRINVVVADDGPAKWALLHDLLTNPLVEWDCIMVMCASAEGCRFYRQMVPAAVVHKRFKDKRLTRLVETCREWNHRRIYVNTLVVIDGFVPEAIRSAVMRDIYMNGRHLKMCLYNVVTHASLRTTLWPKALRCQVDYIYALGDPDPDHRKAFYRQFANVFDAYRTFEMAHEACTHDGGALAINRTATHDDVEHMVSWYCPTPHGNRPLLIGCTYMWQLAYAFGSPSPSCWCRDALESRPNRGSIFC